MADIVVSYTKNDREWSFWIGQELEKLGHTPHIHEWEIAAGGSIPAWMEERFDKADHILFVVSAAYLTAPISNWERQAASFAAQSEKPNFALPVVVERCGVPTLLKVFKRCDLFDQSEDEARARLRDYLAPAIRPSGAIRFPGVTKPQPGLTRPEIASFPGNRAKLASATPDVTGINAAFEILAAPGAEAAGVEAPEHADGRPLPPDRRNDQPNGLIDARRPPVAVAGDSHAVSPKAIPGFQVDRPADKAWTLDKLSSLRSYFSDPKPPRAQPALSDWLRATAYKILINEAGTSEDLFEFGRGWLKEKLLFGPAANIFGLALRKYGGARNPFSNRIRQQQALATYKDEETPPRRRYEAALTILEDVKPLLDSRGVDPDQVLADGAETWALRGAVYRRLSDLEGDVSKLYRALDCYRRAANHDEARETSRFEGYGALNAAFLLDSVAFRLESISEQSPLVRAAQDARKESESLRRGIIDRLGRRLVGKEQQAQQWLCETMAGAYLALGLSRWTTGGPEESEPLLANAGLWTKRAVESKRAEWEVETTHAQWLRVAYLNEPINVAAEELHKYWDAAVEVINVFREKTGGVALTGTEMARSARLGKVGLALSGGGFRASFYHIGVLARLAEADLLRHVDVLSTVSGGSIVGAHYYLLLRELLERVADPSREQYVELVKKLEREFFAAVEKNMRMRGLSNPWVTLKLLCKPGYTRGDRMAELYDEYLYSPRIAPEKGPVRMDSLRIVPQGEGDAFNPRFSNWRRSARVPALLINATCLNTGHSWHFTANWMGEPPELIGDVVDKNERLRRMSYEDAGPPFDELTLGFAVAASACVPGIFEPVQLRGLYPGRLVRLVDGGVHDNQGVDALIGQGCDFILCSDGSGQMGDENTPPNGPVSVPNRSMSVLMKRIREGEYGDLDTRTAASDAGRNLFFVHLKSELPADDVDWVNCEDRRPPKPREPATYGVDHEIQRHLSDIRTDLDSFSEVEASALMTSGYLMASTELERCNARISSRRGAGGFGALDLNVGRQEWGFLQLKDKMALPPKADDVVREDLCHQLRAGQSLFFRNAKLTPLESFLRGFLAALALCAAAAVLYEGAAWIATFAISWIATSRIATWLHDGFQVSRFALIAAGALVLFGGIYRIWCFESFFALFGLIGSNLYFASGLNRLFLRRGSLNRLLSLK